MIYLEHRPEAQLLPWVRLLWYVRAPEAEGRERVLPNGDVQMVINLAREYCAGCREGEEAEFRQAPALLVGTQRCYGVIDGSDLREMVGVVFRAGGVRRFVAEPAVEFRFAETALEAVWGRAAVELRERLMEAGSVAEKFAVLERGLVGRLRGEEAHPGFLLAMREIRAASRRGANVSVREMSAVTGYTSRRLGQLFDEEIGVGPKMFTRIVRFQRAVQRLHRGGEMRWDALALECGYGDQSHFANDFREFSGVNVTTYTQTVGRWGNHIPL
ncbi:MAG: AraC family transcriptional regulator [Acidobacteria bacterium]|nr:AraC family transcriptional regulator [Acidobacteriota bacterium]